MENIKYKTFLFISLLMLTLVSCNNNEIDLQQKDSKILSISDYFKVIGTKSEGGKILLQSTTTEFSQNNYRISDISSSFETGFKKRKSFVIKNNKTKAIFKLKNGNRSDVNDLFGNNFSYSIGNEIKQKNSENNSVYIPELLNIQIDSDELAVGTTINWNVDPLNTNGLILWYRYTPFSQSKYDVVDNNRSILSGGFTIPDEIGTYTITSSDIANLPNNANISFYVTRAGFDFSENDAGEQIGFIGITSVSKELLVTK